MKKATREAKAKTAKQSEFEREEKEMQQRIQTMRRDIVMGGFKFEWGFFPYKIDLSTVESVARAWNHYRKLLYDRGCKVAHHQMCEARKVRDDTEDYDELRVDIMQDRYEV